jgi:hypothetical protein
MIEAVPEDRDLIISIAGIRTSVVNVIIRADRRRNEPFGDTPADRVGVVQRLRCCG